MSAYSTIYLTRTKAKQLVLDKLYDLSDYELAEIVDAIIRGSLYNCRIVEDDAENNDNDLV